VYTEGQDPFGTAGVKCGKRAILRKVGCSTFVNGPPDNAAINGIFSRAVYDSAPYDGCYDEEDVSFRQYLEGFDNDDLEPICIASGCAMHGRPQRSGLLPAPQRGRRRSFRPSRGGGRGALTGTLKMPYCSS
jgi:hypothetical protein